MRDIISIVEAANGELSFSKNQLDEVIRNALQTMCMEIATRTEYDKKFAGFWLGSQQLDASKITDAVYDFISQS